MIRYASMRMCSSRSTLGGKRQFDSAPMTADIVNSKCTLYNICIRCLLSIRMIGTIYKQHNLSSLPLGTIVDAVFGWSSYICCVRLLLSVAVSEFYIATYAFYFSVRRHLLMKPIHPLVPFLAFQYDGRWYRDCLVIAYAIGKLLLLL